MGKIIKAMVLLIVFSVVVPLTFSTSKSQETAISQIKKEYDKTIENEKNYKVQTVKINSSHETSYLSEGDSVRYYTENGELKKVIVFKYSMDEEDNIEKWVEEYYVKNGKPYFIALTNTEKKGKKLENPRKLRAYFQSDGKLIKIIKNEEIHNLANEEIEADILEEFYEIKNLK